MRTSIRFADLTPLALILAACAAPAGEPESVAAHRPPNIVIVLTDDLGYGDASCQGHPSLRTPHIDALARDGVRLTQFVLPSSVCTPSRSALLTGCYPKRLGLHKRVIFPQNDHGLHPEETTLAELLRPEGYATAAFGKWHLGHRRGMLPTDQGFDVFEGIPYSNDMSQRHRPADSKYVYRLPWMSGEAVTEWEPDQSQLTARITQAATDFIEASGDTPFLLYVAHPMPHLPLSASAEFLGESQAGLYGDVVAELDWSIGALRESLERSGQWDNTLFVFTSDNGPRIDQHGRSAGPFRGGKGTPLEGGHRVPCIVSWPGRIAAESICNTPVSIMDLFPTVASIVGTDGLFKATIDGIDVAPALLGEAAPDAGDRPFLYYSRDGELAAIRQGPWKLHLASNKLYQVQHDLHEDRDRSGAQPERVRELADLANQLDANLSAEARAVGRGSEFLFQPERL